MKMMLVGLGGRTAEAIWKGVGDIVENGGTLQDWTLMEQAAEQSEPDVLAVYLGPRPGQVLNLVKRVRVLLPKCQTIAIADTADRALVQAVTDAGCADLVMLPEGPKDLRRALKVLASREPTSRANGEVIAILGAKGGVGATTVAANLAAELSKRTDRRVLLADLNLYLGDASVLLNTQPRPSVLWFLQRGVSADAHTWIETPPMHAAGFQVLGLDGDMTTADPVGADQVVYMVERMKEHYTYIVLDCGNAINEVSLAACSAADQRAVVLTNELAARTGARRRLNALRELELGPVPARAVLNRAQDLTADLRDRIEQAIGMPMVGAISNAWQDAQVALSKGQVLRQSAPRSPATRDFVTLAEALVGTDHQQDRRKRAFFSFFR